MDGIGKPELTSIPFFGIVDQNNIFYTILVMGFLLILGYLATRKLSLVPGKLQSLMEVSHDFLKDITFSTLGDKDGKKMFPLIFTLFIFILISNWIGVLPNFIKFFGSLITLLHLPFDSVSLDMSEGFTRMKLIISGTPWYQDLVNFPAFQEPTRSINTDLALGLVIFIVVHAFGLRNKGLMQYFGDYMDPLPGKFPYILFFFLNPFFYLNLIGALSNVISHSFRLFGNMFGGFMIIGIISSLIGGFIIPILIPVSVGLQAFFGLFSGLVQAFVFTMLAVTYIAQQK